MVVQDAARIGEPEGSSGTKMARMKTSISANRWVKAAPLFLLPVWVVVIACFFYQLVRAGLPLQ